MIRTVLLGAIVATATGIPAHAVNLVTNGGFELLTSNAATGRYHICDNTKPTCISTLTGWSATASRDGSLATNTPGSILLGGHGGSEFNSGFGLYGPIPGSPDGGNFIGVDGDPEYTQTIFQSIGGLTVGKKYEVGFYQSAGQQKGQSGPTTERWQVTFGGVSQLSALQSNPSQSFLPWTFQDLEFTATAVSQVLTFMAIGTPNGAPPVALLDGVSLTARVPDVATWMLMVGGFGLVGAVSRFRRASIRAA